MADKMMRRELERMIQSLEAKKRAVDEILSPLKQALARLDSQPDLNDLREEAARLGNGVKRRAKATLYDRVAAYLCDNGNAPKTARQIALGTGVNSNSLVAVLYTTHTSCFDQTPQQGFKKRWVWSLTDAALADARQHLA
jgi:hypothetical protein